MTDVDEGAGGLAVDAFDVSGTPAIEVEGVVIVAGASSCLDISARGSLMVFVSPTLGVVSGVSKSVSAAVDEAEDGPGRTVLAAVSSVAWGTNCWLDASGEMVVGGVNGSGNLGRRALLTVDIGRSWLFVGALVE